ncbi:amino acid ABC transporter ATP-binding protein [Bifidobacterium aesculapii]|uniref:amino acid ABC transporter ATP-binding protein n=1 Tax=Bifidobacterium aesculapii TaxID=1329411 RepID=UPI0006E13CC7|nr:amino acid ABC transporter ATP-binding protein [Bifidobacterium aesculapii]
MSGASTAASATEASKTGLGKGGISVESLTKRFGDNTILDALSVDVLPGQTVAVIGPSGAGKTTFLRTLNWLEKPDEGSITCNDVTIHAGDEDSRLLSQFRSKSAMVFQHYNLFSNMTALGNVSIGMRRVLGMDRKTAEDKAHELLDRVGLTDVADHYPSQLSGGQQQRVGIARALAMDPEYILFDEPTSALDPEWVGEVLKVMRGIADDGITMIVVSHEMRFVRNIASRVLFLEGGHIVEDGTPAEIFDHPRQERTRQFLSEAFTLPEQQYR